MLRRGGACRETYPAPVRCLAENSWYTSTPSHKMLCLSQVDADFLAMIKEAEDDESKGAEGAPLDVDPADDK